MNTALQSELITLFEDRSLVLEDFAEHQENLRSLREIVGANNVSLQADGSLRVMHYVGFFQKGKTRVQVLPKVFENAEGLASDSERAKALEFVFRLLLWSGFLKGKSLRPQQVGSSDEDLLEIFIQLFVDEFISLFSRKILNAYQERIESQSFIRGKILIAETIRVHPVLRHKHIVRFDEFTIDNPLNRLFKALLLELGRKTNNPHSKQKIALGLTYLDDVSDVRLSTGLFDSIKFNRLNRDYEPLFNLAKLFFHNRQPGLGQGSESTLSLLIPLNRLFEDFIARILEGLSDAEYTFHHQKNRLNLFSHDSEGGIQLRPDYSVTRGHNLVAIMDAKYKSPYSGSTVDLKESDVYQLCAYALRYKVRKLYLIFPKFHGAPCQETLIGVYRIDSGLGVIELKAIQVDVLEKNLPAIVTQLRKGLRPGNIPIDQDQF